MKNIFSIIVVCMAWSCTTKIQTANKPAGGTEVKDAAGNKMLLGTFTKKALLDSPYNTWFIKNYNDYTIDSVSASQLKPLLKNKSFQIFMGTWCGDSRREVPRMLKLLQYCGVPESNIRMVMVNNADTAYKQSPFHEEKGKFIFRVPDLLVYEKGTEAGRIVESPVVSLEKDMLAVLQQNNYRPNYRAAAVMINYFAKDDFATDDLSVAALVTQIKPLAAYAGELNSLGRILLNEAEYKKAVVLFKVNAAIYPEDVMAKEKLAVALWKSNDLAAAQKCCNEILAVYPNNTTAAAILKKINN